MTVPCLYLLCTSLDNFNLEASLAELLLAAFLRHLPTLLNQLTSMSSESPYSCHQQDFTTLGDSLLSKASFHTLHKRSSFPTAVPGIKDTRRAGIHLYWHIKLLLANDQPLLKGERNCAKV